MGQKRVVVIRGIGRSQRRKNHEPLICYHSYLPKLHEKWVAKLDSEERRRAEEKKRAEEKQASEEEERERQETMRWHLQFVREVLAGKSPFTPFAWYYAEDLLYFGNVTKKECEILKKMAMEYEDPVEKAEKEERHQGDFYDDCETWRKANPPRSKKQKRKWTGKRYDLLF